MISANVEAVPLYLHCMYMNPKLIGVVLLQQKYRADAIMTIANVDAVPLYLHCLQRAAPELQLRGLQIWRKLLQSNMANLSASDR